MVGKEEKERCTASSDGEVEERRLAGHVISTSRWMHILDFCVIRLKDLRGILLLSKIVKGVYCEYRPSVFSPLPDSASESRGMRRWSWLRGAA